MIGRLNWVLQPAVQPLLFFLEATELARQCSTFNLCEIEVKFKKIYQKITYRSQSRNISL